jgi:murein L,D-transpeptidase YcbB/YkuD
MTRWTLVLGLTSALWIASPAQAVEPDAPDELITRTDAIYFALQDKLSNKARDLGADKPEQIALSAYYGNRSGNLLWVTENGLTSRVAALRKVVAQAEDWGLNAGDYNVTDSDGFKRYSGQPAEWLADAELRTSLTAILYARHAQAGRVDPASLDAEFLDFRPARPDPLAIMKGLADAGDRLGGFLESFHPTHEQFRLLKQKLAEMRGGRGPARNAVKIPDGPSLKPGISHPQVALLRQRLSVPAMRDVMSDGPPEEYFDDSLADAVAAFQQQSGIAGRGVVNAATRAALNKGVSTAGTAQILINMERWRWEPRELGARHLYVNIPEFLVRLMDGGRLVHEERIVVGTAKNRTPAFSDEMEYVVFNPYWNVPESILLKEMLPVARRNPEFFARNQLEVVWQGRRTVDPYMVDWENVNPQKVLVRQVPGPSNALGVVKFLFPNKHSVYMHDTPSKNLFNQSVRAYSHGCMRVRNPVKFAEILLSDQGWSPSKVRSALDTTEDYQVTLDRKLPVHIMYFTLWADKSGRLQEFGDIYDYDDRLKVAMRLEGAPKARRKTQEDFDPRENGLGN